MYEIFGFLMQWGPHHGPMGPYGGTWFGWLFGPIMLLITLGLLVGGAYLMIQLLQNDGAEVDGALAELERLYARGEIDTEEFEKRRDRLTGRHS